MRFFLSLGLVIALSWLTSCGTPHTPVLITFGDSITRGSGVQPQEKYANLMSNDLKLDLVNKGSSGNRLIDDLFDTQRRETPVYATDVITLMVCYNDMRHGGLDREYLKLAMLNLEEALTEFSKTDAKVFVGGCLYMFPTSYASPVPFWANGSDQAVDTFNQSIRDVVARYGPNFKFVDVSKAFDPTDRDNWYQDLVHPSAKAHRKIANEFLTAMGKI